MIAIAAVLAASVFRRVSMVYRRAEGGNSAGVQRRSLGIRAGLAGLKGIAWRIGTAFALDFGSAVGEAESCNG